MGEKMVAMKVGPMVLKLVVMMVVMMVV